jgi:hypothetical protein
MSWRRSKSNAQQVREIHRRRDTMRRAVDAQIAQLEQASTTRGGVR